jgi:hypothetical protein
LALVYSGGPYRNDVYTVSTRQQLLNSINTTLTAAGWSSQNIFAFAEIVWTGQPNNNNTVTVAGQTYTFKTIIANANDVLIDTTANDTLRNLFNAINKGPGEGTKYGNNTPLNQFITAADFRETTNSSGAMRVQSKINTTPFGQQALYSFSESTVNFDFTFPNNRIAGYIWTSPKTPVTQQQLRVYGVDAQEDFNTGILKQCIRLYAMDENELYRSQPFIQASNPLSNGLGFRCVFLVSGSTTWRVIANKYSFYLFIDGGGPNGDSGSFCTGIPYIYPFLQPRVITNATNTNPIVITTSAPHGYVTGDTVFHRGIGGNTAANGTFTITVTSPTQYTIPIQGNGVYTTGGVCSKPTNDRVAMAFWGAGDINGGAAFPYNRLGAENAFSYQCLNGNSFLQSNQNGVGSISLLTPTPSRLADAGSTMQFVNGSRVILEPHIAISGSLTTKARWAGQLYDAFISSDAQPQGTTASFDGHNWYCLGPSNGSINNSRGSLWVVVP